MSDLDSTLHALLAAGHLEQVVSQARRFLEREPEAIAVHYYLALALIRSQRSSEARNSVEFLLARAPDVGLSHHAAFEYFASLKQYRKAREHIRTAVALDPDTAVFHLHSAVAALRFRDIRGARAAVESARQLEPEDPEVIRLYVEVHGLEETSARSAWDRIRQLEAALSIDPDNAGLHESIGDIHLNELDQPREAENHYRQSLRRQPANRHSQKSLFQAVARQRFVYRLLSIPTRTGTWMSLVVKNWAHQPWRLLFVLIGFKAVLAFLVWLIIVTILLWPASKVYEWLLISEIQCAANVPARAFRLKRALLRWPFWARFIACVGLIIALWIFLFSLLGVPMTVGFLFLLVLTAIHALVLLIGIIGQKFRTRQGRRQAKKQSLFSGPTPPPIPRH